MLKSTKLLILLLIAGSAACGVPRPDADVCIVIAPPEDAEYPRQRKCYNLAKDYNDDGTLKAEAKPVYRPNPKIEDLNKAMLVDSPHDADNPNPAHFEDGIARIKAWIKKLREAYENKDPK